MLLTFKTKAYANISMMGDIGSKILTMMDFGTTVPGSINVEDVATALDNLKQALANLPDSAETTAESDQPAVSLHTRAIPIIELLEAAVAEQEYVRWE